MPRCSTGGVQFRHADVYKNEAGIGQNLKQIKSKLRLMHNVNELGKRKTAET